MLELKEFLIKNCKYLNIDLNEYQAEQFIIYLKLLQSQNKRKNLTTIEDSYNIITDHFIDSLSCILGASFFSRIQVIDIGTGAGFPGIPLKIYEPKIELTLIESRQKKIDFVREVCGILRLKDVKVLQGRAEEYGHSKEYRGEYDVAVARAVSQLSTLIEYALPFLRKGGRLVAHKGSAFEEDLQAAQHIMKLVGGRIEEVKEVSLPGTERKTNLIIIIKERITPFQFPRSTGIPQKKPLLWE
ncbi:MAG: 16S rRNA (guanine(527)-N(7))-methyltransferase RsmG [bacterium]|nr:16S rRNA (guanine(527)-N(7))-methyltransferase RsmG [bacterium]